MRKKNFDRFIEVVKKYAEAYRDFEEIQKAPDFVRMRKGFMVQ